LVVSNLGAHKVKDCNVRTYDASTNGFPLALTCSTLTICLITFLTEKTNSGVGENALSHGETLLIVSPGDTKDVPCKLLTKDRSIDLLSHTSLVKILEAFFVFNFNHFLKACRWDSDIDLHCSSIEECEEGLGFRKLEDEEDDDDEEEKKANMNAGNQDMSGGDRDDQEYVLTDAPGVFDECGSAKAKYKSPTKVSSYLKWISDTMTANELYD